MKKMFYGMLLLLGLSNFLMAQNDEPIYVFGYFAGNYNYSSKTKVVLPNPVKGLPGLPIMSSTVEQNIIERNTAMLAQLNLFFQKDYYDFTAFSNLEIKNSFNYEKNWGSISLEEAWVRYQVSDNLKIKVGLLIPEFNSLNTVKNKTPFLPYVLRPWIYEAQLAELLNVEDYLPEQAFLQFYGKQNLSENSSLDYAIYLGNSEASYRKNTIGGFSVKGEDTSGMKMIGGRLGMNYQNFKVGLSSTYDHDNQTQIFVPGRLSGDIPRVRLGADFSFDFLGFTFESEYIAISHNLDDAQKNWLKDGYKNYLYNAKVYPVLKELGTVTMLAATETNQKTLYLLGLQATKLQSDLAGVLNYYGNNVISSDKMDKSFYFLTLGYNISEKLYSYLNYSYIQSDIGETSKDGMKQYQIGINYRPSAASVIKASYCKVIMTGTEFDSDFLNASISVMF